MIELIRGVILFRLLNDKPALYGAGFNLFRGLYVISW